MQVLAVVSNRSRCRVAIVSGKAYISYPRNLIPRVEAKYIALRFGHLFPANGRGAGMFGQNLARTARRKIAGMLNSEDEISLSLLERTR